MPNKEPFSLCLILPISLVFCFLRADDTPRTLPNETHQFTVGVIRRGRIEDRSLCSYDPADRPEMPYLVPSDGVSKRHLPQKEHGICFAELLDRTVACAHGHKDPRDQLKTGYCPNLDIGCRGGAVATP